MTNANSIALLYTGKMSKIRVEKLQELIKQETGNIILRNLKDPRIGFVTVTKVDLSPDLRLARIYVSIMGNDTGGSWRGLNNSLGYIRRELGHRIRLRYVPDIEFVHDRSLDYSEHIQHLLNETKASETKAVGELTDEQDNT